MTTRADIVACARTYVGTPFGHQGRQKGMLLDCVGLPLMVAGELGLKDRFENLIHGGLYTKYTAQPLGNFVKDTAARHLVRKPIDQIAPGDVLALRVVSAACHVGMVGDSPEGLTLIHAQNGAGEKCVEHLLDDQWRSRIAGVFSFPEVNQEEE